MQLNKSLQLLFKKSPSNELKPHHKKKAAIFWNKFIKILTIKFIALVTILFFFIFFGVSFAQAPFHALIDQITKPKPITQSSKVLPSDVQEAIIGKAKQEIKQEHANALLATTFSNTSTNPLLTNAVSFQAQQGDSIIQSVLSTLQEATTSDPSIRAKLRIKRIDGLIIQLQNLLTADRSDNTINQAVTLIKDIGHQTSQIATDPKIQTDREVVSLQIEQYNRLQLVLQKIEDQLPISAYLKVEDARQKYVISGAIASLNGAPNLDMVHNIAIKEVTSIVGKDYAELKAIEILTDLQDGLTPSAQQKLTGLQKQLALQFEKRMVALPPDVRTRKLQNFIQLSYGNPLTQAKSFEQMKSLLTDREMILSVDSLKELALEKLKDRIFEIKDQSTSNQFSDLSFKNLQDLKILTLMKSDVLTSGSDQQKKQIADLEAKSLDKVINTFVQAKDVTTFFAKTANKPTDLLDVSLITQLTDTLNNSSKVSPEVKRAISDIKQKTLQQFIANIETQGFVTSLKRTYNPVSTTSDVRILLTSPQAIPLLEEIKKETPTLAFAIAVAERAESNIVADHLLTQVNDPVIFDQYTSYISDTPTVKQIIENTIPASIFTTLGTKEAFLQKQEKADEQVLYEKTQQIIQEIFVAGDKQNLTAILPSSIQDEITQLKQEIPNNSVPQLTVPVGVKLPEVAALPSDVQNALITLAKEEIHNRQSTLQITTTDIAVETKELGVSAPTILPDNPLYSVVQLVRNVTLLTKIDPIDKAEELIRQDNQKTLEAALLVEQSQSKTSIDTAVQTLDSVKQDVEKIQGNVAQIKAVEQADATKVDGLLNQIIGNDITRETVISSIENTIHGDAYLAVENIRQDVLKERVDTVLSITDNNIQKLTDAIQATVSQNTTTPATAVAQDVQAVEILNEIARTEPESAQKILQTSEATIATNLEKILLSQSADIRAQEMSSLAQKVTGNPVRQFEALEVLKDDFKNPSTILLAEELKGKVTENLQERIAEIPDASAQAVFADTVIGNQPQDLKAVTEIASEIAPPQNAGIIEVLPIVQEVNAVKAEIIQNIVDTYKDKPAELAKTDFFTNNPTPDVTDIQVAKELVSALSSAPEVTPEVMRIAKQEETKIVDTFIANISKPEFQVTVSTNTQTSVQTTPQQSPSGVTSDQTNVSALAAQTLNGRPDTLTTLIDVKADASPAQQTNIDLAIKTEITIIKDELTNQTDPTITQAAVAQIIDNPAVAHVVEQVSGQTVIQAVEQKAQEVQQQANTDATQLQITVIEVQKEVFSVPVSSPSTVEQTLPQPVQQEIQQIKQEVPAAQTPQVVVAAQTQETVTVAAQPVDTTPVVTTQPAAQPVTTSAPSTSEPQPASPAPSAPSAPSQPAPAENKPAESAPAPAAPAVEAPAAPGI